ncbi:hypothetical protein [Pseudomonas sp. DWP3-1-2]|uniref:hypothetical protein n=1 Tax=Pseudomonas sp. DWP3-1-2 TaxID=2804645 RepID=UPI003CED7E01
MATHIVMEPTALHTRRSEGDAISTSAVCIYILFIYSAHRKTPRNKPAALGAFAAVKFDRFKLHAQQGIAYRGTFDAVMRTAQQ